MRILLTANTSFALVNFRAGLIRALRQDGHELLALVPADDYTADLQAAGCEIVDLRMDRRGTSLPREVLTLAGIGRKLHRIRPDVILSYTIKNNLYAGIVARQMSIPILPNVTGLGTLFSRDSALGHLARQMYSVAFHAAPVVFFQNTDDRDRFVSLGIVPADRTHVLPGSGVEPERFTVTPLPARDGAPVFLLIARLLWEKGIGEFVEAAHRVRAEFPGASFRLLGALERPGKAAIPASTIDAWVAGGTIDYLGTVRDVRPAIADADCVVLPSYYREGTPRVLLEAAACGRPIVTTDTAGCRDVVLDGRTGYVVAQRSAEDLSRGLLRFAGLTARERTEMGAAGRALVIARYDERIVVDAYRAAISRIRGDAPGRLASTM